MTDREPIVGAPKLPSGYFYRVRSNSAGPLVEIRRKQRIGSRCVARSYILPKTPGDYATATAQACERAHEDFTGRHLQSATEAAVLAAYRGDHT